MLYVFPVQDHFSATCNGPQSCHESCHRSFDRSYMLERVSDVGVSQLACTLNNWHIYCS